MSSPLEEAENVSDARASCTHNKDARASCTHNKDAADFQWPVGKVSLGALANIIYSSHYVG